MGEWTDCGISIEWNVIQRLKKKLAIQPLKGVVVV